MSTWAENAIFYHIYPLGFCGAPEENEGGDPEPRLDKLEEWIPHLKDLGVNALYLGPVFQSSRHGYDTIDYRRVDCRLGDNESFKALCEQLHDAGIRIVLDGVFNHVGRRFWAFEDVQKNGQSSPYCDWFENLNFGGPSPMGDPFWYEGWQGHFELVKLNLRNPAVRDHLLDAVCMWMDEFHIDGLRLDAADCVDPEFFKALRGRVKEKDPDFWLFAEIIHGDYNRWANGDMLDSVTNYECWKGIWSSLNTKNYFEIAHSLSRQFGPGGVYKNIYTYNFVENHDVDRLASTLTDPALLPNAYTILYTMPGAPSVYYGGEWAVEGKKAGGSDAPLRPCLELEEDTPLCKHLAALAKCREALPALRLGDYENVIIQNQQLLFKRTYNGQSVFVALNLSDEDYRFEMPCQIADLWDYLDGKQTECRNDGGRIHILMPPCSGRILAE